MEYNQLLELIMTVSGSNISGFQYEDGDNKILISKGEKDLTADKAGGVVLVTKEVAKEVTRKAENTIKSPLVGTFYEAPSEDAEPFVKVGDKVKKGQTVAIVEAMKLMNDIESEFEGVVSEVFVKNGDCVEYGQPLFAIG